MYRAVRSCPWAKQLYLFAFHHLRGRRADAVGEGMNDAELRALFRVMSEKELRLHVDLNEMDVHEDTDEG